MKKAVITTLLILTFTFASGCGVWRWLNTEPKDPSPEWGEPMEPTRPFTATNKPAE